MDKSKRRELTGDPGISGRLIYGILPPPDLSSREAVCAYLENDLPDTIEALGELVHEGIGKDFVDQAFCDLAGISHAIGRFIAGEPARFEADPQVISAPDAYEAVGAALYELSMSDTDSHCIQGARRVLAKVLKYTLEHRAA
jgi:hypothetical protein